MSLYAERAFFDGDQCQHCADREEHLRLRRIERQRVRQVAVREWAALPAPRRAIDDARDHLAAMPAERLAALNLEWGTDNGRY